MTHVLVGSVPLPALQPSPLSALTKRFPVLKHKPYTFARSLHRVQQAHPVQNCSSHTYRRFLRGTGSTNSLIHGRQPSQALLRLRRQYSTGDRKVDARQKLAYRLSAASCGKGRKFVPANNIYPFDTNTQDHVGIETAEHLFERRLNRPNSGQDAFFMSKIGNQSDAVAFGIADGVGGWADRGVDPADFSHGLCSRMAFSAFNWPATNPRLLPGKLMQSGYDLVLKDRRIRAGGSTACVGCAYPSGRLQMANLGDSGFLLLRAGRVHHYSNPQTHAFNTPYQLSVVPPKILAQASVFGGAPYIDTPSRADLSEDTLQDGDVLILATDGVWDNLNSQDLLSLVGQTMMNVSAWTWSGSEGIIASEKLPMLTHLVQAESQEPHQSLQALLASSIVSAAKTASLDPRRDGPFAKEVQKRYPQDGWKGGKADDICAVVLVAVDCQTAAGEADQ